MADVRKVETTSTDGATIIIEQIEDGRPFWPDIRVVVKAPRFSVQSILVTEPMLRAILRSARNYGFMS